MKELKRDLQWTGVWIACLAVLLWSCAAFQQTVDSMTPLDKATLAMETYTKMSKDYRAQVAKPNLSAAEKEILKTKYAILVEAGPKVDAYNKAVKGNLPLDQMLAQWVEAFITQYRY